MTADRLPELVLTDFDGTLTRRDTFPQILRFLLGKKFFLYLPVFSAYVVLMKAGLLTAQAAKESILALALRGWKRDRVQQAGRAFVAHLMKTRQVSFWPGALEMIRRHKEGGGRVIVVSASPEEWVAPFAETLGIEYIATRLEYDEHGFTGKILGKNCNGEEKVGRIRALIPDLSGWHVTAYGDSSGDLPMLALAQKPRYKYFQNDWESGNGYN